MGYTNQFAVVNCIEVVLKCYIFAINSPPCALKAHGCFGHTTVFYVGHAALLKHRQGIKRSSKIEKEKVNFCHLMFSTHGWGRGVDKVYHRRG